MRTTTPNISKEIFVEILQDKGLAQSDDVLIFQTLYSQWFVKKSAPPISLRTIDYLKY